MIRTMWSVACSLIILAAIPAAPSARTTGDDERVRSILFKRCGSCHDSAATSPQAKALAVFDLRQRAWMEHVSSERLRKMEGRLESFGAKTSERIAVGRFVERELGRRASAPRPAR